VQFGVEDFALEPEFLEEQGVGGLPTFEDGQVAVAVGAEDADDLLAGVELLGVEAGLVFEGEVVEQEQEVLPASALHEQLVELGLGDFEGVREGDGVHLDARDGGQPLGLAASHVHEDEVETVLHGADVVGEGEEGVEGGEVELQVGEVEFDGLLEGAEVAVLFAEAEGEVLPETDLHGSDEEEVEPVDLLEEVADAVEGVPLLEDAVLAEEEEERGGSGLAEEEGTG
jgi:hypothetical protein